MNKINFEDFKKIMLYDINEKTDPCIEVDFEIDDCETYDYCWLGKMNDEETGGFSYWFGLVPDGSQAFDYPTFEEFANTKVFYGSKSLKEIWDLVSINSIDGGLIEEALPFYLEN